MNQEPLVSTTTHEEEKGQEALTPEQILQQAMDYCPRACFVGMSGGDDSLVTTLKRNPVSEILGLSGECLCGAFAHPGEKALVRIVEPATAERLDALEVEVRAAGHNWGWEERPPKKARVSKKFMPFCVGCTKVA